MRFGIAVVRAPLTSADAGEARSVLVKESIVGIEGTGIASASPLP
jgi:hypothetical protein